LLSIFFARAQRVELDWNREWTTNPALTDVQATKIGVDDADRYLALHDF